MEKRITAGDYCPSMDEVFYAEMADYENGDENGDEMADYENGDEMADYENENDDDDEVYEVLPLKEALNIWMRL